jgi:hypothetical protein
LFCLITTNKAQSLHRTNIFSILNSTLQFHILTLFQNQICFHLSQNIPFLKIVEFIRFLKYCRPPVWNFASQWDWIGIQYRSIQAKFLYWSTLLHAFSKWNLCPNPNPDSFIVLGHVLSFEKWQCIVRWVDSYPHLCLTQW